MQDYSNIWKSYLEFCQRSWLDMSRFWFMALPNTGGAKSGKEEAFSPFTPFVATESWMAMFKPWMPKIDAHASLDPSVMEEATRVSMQMFMPWHSDPLWVNALSSKTKESKQEQNIIPDDKKVIEDVNLTPEELEVKRAIKRSRTQD